MPVDRNGFETATRVPVPDPTVLTTAALVREIAALKELFDTRLNAMDKAILLLQAFADRQPTAGSVALTVAALRELVEEKFDGIQTQIRERDVQTEKASRDVKSAVDAAFAAAKEAVGEQNKSNALSITKSEATTTKQIDSILELIKTGSAGTEGKITDLKERLTVLESRASLVEPANSTQLTALTTAVNGLINSQSGATGHGKGIGESWGIIGAIAGLAIGLGGLIIAVLIHLK